VYNGTTGPPITLPNGYYAEILYFCEIQYSKTTVGNKTDCYGNAIGESYAMGLIYLQRISDSLWVKGRVAPVLN
jgi:hypothetical protein